MIGLRLLAGVMVLFGASGFAMGGFFAGSPDLPPDGGTYVHKDGTPVLFTTDDLRMVLQDPVLAPDAATTGRNTVGPDVTYTFDATLVGTLGTTIVNFPGVGEVSLAPQIVVLEGPIEMIVLGQAGQSTGTWDTEILSMDLSGTVPVPELVQFGAPQAVPVQMLESTGQASLGETTVTDIGGGHFRIESFFDVFAEIVVPDITSPGSFLTTPSEGSFRMELLGNSNPIPEPGSLVVMAAGLVGIGLRRGKRVV